MNPNYHGPCNAFTTVDFEPSISVLTFTAQGSYFNSGVSPCFHGNIIETTTMSGTVTTTWNRVSYADFLASTTNPRVANNTFLLAASKTCCDDGFDSLFMIIGGVPSPTPPYNGTAVRTCDSAGCTPNPPFPDPCAGFPLTTLFPVTSDLGITFRRDPTNSSLLQAQFTGLIFGFTNDELADTPWVNGPPFAGTVTVNDPSFGMDVTYSFSLS
jgi:hypothetical protein